MLHSRCMQDLWGLRAHAHAQIALAESAKKAKIVKGVVIALTALVTHFSMRYVYRKMDEVKEGVVYRRRKARCVPRFPFRLRFFAVDLELRLPFYAFPSSRRRRIS